MYLFVVNGNINGYGAGMDLNTDSGLGGGGFLGQGGAFGGDFNNGFGGNLNGQGEFQGGFY
jgi:hypothetical protein